MNGQSPSEQRIAELNSARSWLAKRHQAVRVDTETTYPVPRYQVTAVPRWMTRQDLLDYATSRGWPGLQVAA